MLSLVGENGGDQRAQGCLVASKDELWQHCQSISYQIHHLIDNRYLVHLVMVQHVASWQLVEPTASFRLVAWVTSTLATFKPPEVALKVSRFEQLILVFEEVIEALLAGLGQAGYLGLEHQCYPHWRWRAFWNLSSLLMSAPPKLVH